MPLEQTARRSRFYVKAVQDRSIFGPLLSGGVGHLKGIVMNKIHSPAIEKIINENNKSLPIVKEAVRDAIKYSEVLSDQKASNDIERFIKKYGSLNSKDRSIKGMTVNQITDLVIRDIETGNLKT